MPVVSEPERALVRDCLQRLEGLARRHPRGGGVSTAVKRFLTTEPFAAPCRSAVMVTHMARHEPRLRQVVRVREQVLNASEVITEGPGDLRLGVKGMDRLYEYWVYLKVLQHLEGRFGAPLGDGFAQLGVKLRNGRLRLELPNGTSVSFPGGIHAAFTPTVTQSGRASWMGLELVSLPPAVDQLSPTHITPDVVVFREGDGGDAVVIDAKYRARHAIDHSLWDVHRKYSRIRHGGMGVVSQVVVAHPHESLEFRWAGSFRGAR
jgi:hypothetical protein